MVAISDVIALTSDLGNHIPDKSWMLYLLELFDRQNIAAELNLICSFNNDGKFDAIFNGVNQYQFKDIQPLLGHSYMRQIILDSQTKTVSYVLEDTTTGQAEGFSLSFSGNAKFVFEVGNHFTGIEWWNKTGNNPYPIRYQVEISQLVYGVRDKVNDTQRLVYLPYGSLTPNSEGHSSHGYPISFFDARAKDGCICYSVSSGNCNGGLRYNC